QGCLHFGCTDGAIVDIGRNVGRGGENSAMRDAVHVVSHSRVHIGQGPNRALDTGARTRANRGRTFRRTPPATLQFVERGVVLAPLATSEESPFKSVLKTLVILPFTATGDFRAGPLDVQAIKDRVMPGPVVSPFANGCIQPLPVLRCDRFVPIV